MGRSDGSGVFVNRGAGATAQSFTWAGWLNLNASTSGAILSYLSGGQLRYRLSYSATLDRLVWELFNGATVIASAVADELGSPLTGSWYWIEVYYDAARLVAGIRVYTDRTAASSLSVPLADEVNLSATWIAAPANLRFGATQIQASVDGSLTHWNFWGRILNVREETTLNQPTDWPWAFNEIPQPPNLYDIDQIPGVEIVALWDLPLAAGQQYDSWEIWRSVNGADFTLAATQPAVQTNYEEIFGAPDASQIGKTYRYKVRGVVGTIKTVFSQTLSYRITSALFAGTQTVFAPVEFAARPRLLIASEPPTDLVAGAGAGIVRLSWTDNTLGQYGHEIWRNDGNGYFKLATVPAGLDEYDDGDTPLGDVIGDDLGNILGDQSGNLIGSGDLAISSASTYKVRAVGFGEPSDFSDEAEQGDILGDQSGNPVGDQGGDFISA